MPPDPNKPPLPWDPPRPRQPRHGLGLVISEEEKAQEEAEMKAQEARNRAFLLQQEQEQEKARLLKQQHDEWVRRRQESAKEDKDESDKKHRDSEKKKGKGDGKSPDLEGVGMALAAKAGAFGRGAQGLYEYTQGRGSGLGGAVASFARKQGEQMGLGSVGSGALGLAGGVAGGVAGMGIGMGTWALGKAIEPLSAILSEISSKLDPLNILREALAAPTSGAGAFGSTIKLLGTAMSGILAPAFLGLGAGVLAFTRILEADLIPQAMDLAFQTLPAIMDAMEAGLDATLFLWQTMREFGEWMSSAMTVMNDNVSSPLRKNVLDPLGLDVVGGLQKGWEDYRYLKDQGYRAPKLGESGWQGPDSLGKPIQRDQNGRPITPPGMKGSSGGVDTGKEVARGLQTMMQEIRLQMMPKAQATDIVGASRAAQMAALNQSPLERETFQTLLNVYRKMEEGVNKMDTLRPSTY